MSKIEKVKKSPSETAKIIDKMRERDATMVTGMFRNLEAQGGGVRFDYKAYKGDEMKTYEFFDGERYTIPYGIARHLNNNCYYNEYKHLRGEFGDQGIRAAHSDGSVKTDSMVSARKVHRFAFVSNDFINDNDMVPSPLIEVKMAG
jgi:hypothetical protein